MGLRYSRNRLTQAAISDCLVFLKAYVRTVSFFFANRRPRRHNGLWRRACFEEAKGAAMDCVDVRNLPVAPEIDADICIIGSGPAGLTLARELSDIGLKILVV